MPACRTLLALLACASVSLAADPVKLRTLAGKTVEGELVGITNQAVVLKTAAGEVTTPTAAILGLDLQPSLAPAAPKYADVQLTDGSLLHAAEWTIKGQNMELKLVGGQEVKLPLSAVDYLVNNAQGAKVRKEWEGFLAKRGNNDLLAKSVEGEINTFDGTFGDADDKGLTIPFTEASTGEKFSVKLASIHGMSFLHKSDVDSPVPLCKVFDTSRNLLVARTITQGPKGFGVTTVAGVTVDYPRERLARLDYSKGKLTYLSDLDPVKVTETGDAQEFFHYRRDVTCDGNPLKLVYRRENKERDKGDFAKGLWLHPYTELVYDINAQYKDFRAVVGFDPSIGGDNPVRVLIQGDGTDLFSADIKREDDPRSIKLDVKNVKTLRLVVSAVNHFSSAGHVILGDARVSK